ncbi:MAG TPA: mitochondrial fission ELM1 family protein [Hyphomicrobiaceae bacterium]|nr:mitochondrial fission ELM1 family protein [Hyphomicrobiaceae bacterium]
MQQTSKEALDGRSGVLAGARGWIITDGKAGHEVQTRGVFDALGLDYEMKPVRPKGLFKALSPWMPVSPNERFGTPASIFCPPWPDFAISIGRTTTPYIRALKRRAGLKTYTIILQDPKTNAAAADLYWVPEHDTRRGANVITTLTAPHGFTQSRLGELRSAMPPAIAALPSPRVAVMLGGATRVFRYGDEDLTRLGAALASLQRLGAGLMITPSRRTSAEIAHRVRLATEGSPRLIWDREGENPYPYYLAHADALIVAGDSINMTGEACATGKPVYVFMPSGGSAKFRRFHTALRAHGATRPLPEHFEALETWTYAPLDSATLIAAEIERRWTRRSHMLSGLLATGALTGRNRGA